MDAKPQNKTQLIEYDFDTGINLEVPGDWNTQNSQLYYYEGSVWYRKRFDLASDLMNTRHFIHFGASNYRTDVYLNGKKLGYNIGGFNPFYFEGK